MGFLLRNDGTGSSVGSPGRRVEKPDRMPSASRSSIEKWTVSVCVRMGLSAMRRDVETVRRGSRLDRTATGRHLLPPMIRGTWWVGVLPLLSGLLALAVPPHPFDDPPTWETLLAPYSTGAALPHGFRVHEIRRGADNGIVISVRGPDDAAAVEVIVVERGRWKSVHRSRSFTIDYELPRSPAAERDDITALLAETIGSRDHGLTAPDAVRLRAGDSTVLPWWLEMLRGLRGMLLGSSLVVLALLALRPAPGLARVAVALGVADLTARLAGVPVLRTDVGVLWIAPASAGLLFVALRGRRSGPVTGRWPALAVAALALGLRLALGAWGPLHVNGHGARFVAGAARDPADIAAHGPGYGEIFAPVAALAPSNPDWAIFACNALLSALVVPLAFAIGRATGLGTRAALVAALLLAIDPVAIRIGATEAYLSAIAFLCTAGGAAMLVALHEIDAGDRQRAAALLVVAGLLLAEAARIHPCAWVVMATVPFVVLAGDAGSWRRRIFVTFVAAAISGGVLAFTSATALLDVLGNIRTGTVFRPPVPSLRPLLWIALAAGVYALFAPRRRLAVPAGISVAAMLLTRHAFDASSIWEQSYFRLYLVWPVVAVLACVPSAWFRRRWLAVPAVAVLVLAWVRFGWPVVVGRSTEHLEYRWVREQLRRLAPECRVVHLAFAGNRVLLLPTYVDPSRPAVAMDARRPETVAAALAPAACLYYVHSSLCSTAVGRPACDALEGRLTLVPIARASFAAAREFETFGHDRDPVETWIARVERVDGG